MTHIQLERRNAVSRDMWLLALSVLLGMAVIGFGYGYGYEIQCDATFPLYVCRGLTIAVPRALCATAVITMILVLRPEIRAETLPMIRRTPSTPGIALMAVGAILILVPLFYRLITGIFLPEWGMIAGWISGLFAVAFGLAIAVIDTQRIDKRWLRRTAFPLILAALVAIILPDLAIKMRFLWSIESVTNATFQSVIAVLQLLGQTVTADAQTREIWIDTAGVLIWPSCSGIEGFVIIGSFTLFYLYLFRSQLILGRAWLLLPIALCLSWMLNITRISVLLLIGRYISMDLAVGGFHSHAGWLLFLSLAMAVALAAHHISWFQRDTDHINRPTRPSFFADTQVAMLLPFAVFMASSTFVSAVSTTPGLLYPLRAALMAGILMLCLPAIRRFDFKLDGVALGSGLICGLLWIVTAPDAAAADTSLSLALGDLAPIAFAAWVTIRVVGTAILVPMVEELFFRGYLQSRLSELPIAAARIIAIVVPSLLFAFLHDRFVAALAAGLLFAVIAQRKGRVTDAIQSHAAANTVIAVAALTQGNWHLI